LPEQTVFIVAGEASGDLHPSLLARKLLTLAPGLTLKIQAGDRETIWPSGDDIQERA